MEVEPGYHDHWKTRWLVHLAENRLAWIWPLRLWGYCELKLTDRLEGFSEAELHAVCRWYGSDRLKSPILLEVCGFITKDDGAYIVNGFREHNPSLFENGKNEAGAEFSNKPHLVM